MSISWPSAIFYERCGNQIDRTLSIAGVISNFIWHGLTYLEVEDAGHFPPYSLYINAASLVTYFASHQHTTACHVSRFKSRVVRHEQFVCVNV